MPIPTSQFENWTSTGADNGAKETADAIERILRMDRSAVENGDGSFKVIRQGSYKNHTHTYASSDVDVLAILTSAWKQDLSELDADERDRYNSEHVPADYAYIEFKDDVWNWMQNYFGREYIDWHGKAIEISGESGRIEIDADLVPAVQFRKYHSYPADGEPEFIEGIAFKPRHRGDWFINYPQVHYQNGCDMHANYKETVRIFKNARDYYNEHFDSFWSIGAHSYGIECLIYNVPEDILKLSDPAERFDAVLEYLENADFDEEDKDEVFTQVSEMEALFGDSNTQWDTSEAETLVDRLRELWDDWYNKRANAQLLD